MPVIPLNGAKSSFQLDTSGVAAFFGGEEAISAMSSVNTFKGPWRKWFGWYNSPGSYGLARKYGQLAGFRFWDGLFPGVDVEPADLFGLAGDKGPQFVGAASATYIRDTGQVGSLLMKECQKLAVETRAATTKTATAQTSPSGSFEMLVTAVDAQTNTKNRSPVTATIVDLEHVAAPTVDARLPPDWTCFMTCVPILSSTAACVVCGIYRDWYSLSMILLGMLSNGVACVVLGNAKFEFKHHQPAPNCPRGDGILFSDTESDFVVVRGKEEAVNSVTRGQFVLQFPGKPEYRNVGLAAMLLTAQSFIQLLLIPQGELFGQIMFLATLAISWVFNCILSSLDKYKLQRRVLTQEVLGVQTQIPAWPKYQLGSRTGMLAFLLLLLPPHNHSVVLDKLLPNETETWKVWKRVVSDRVRRRVDLVFDESEDYGDLEGNEKELLKVFYGDAEQAYQVFKNMPPEHNRLKVA